MSVESKDYKYHFKIICSRFQGIETIRHIRAFLKRVKDKGHNTKKVIDGIKYRSGSQKDIEISLIPTEAL
jgi:hypothetical protein